MKLALGLAALVVIGLLWWWARRRGESLTPGSQSHPGEWSLGTRIGAVFRRSFDEAWAELENSLIAADLGAGVAADLVAGVKGTATDLDTARARLKTALIDAFGTADRHLSLSGAPSVIVVVGVNGSGKTTTVAKLAAMLMAEGRSVLVGAADTYRAAAIDQLERWAEMLEFELVRSQPNADAASVAFDAVAAAEAREIDVVVVDTAGRLHSDRNLMDELSKVVRVLGEGARTVDETLLVIDGSTGQNAISQATLFTEAVGITGIAITKLDGSAKGGAVLAIERDLGIPVKLIGVGERPGDLLHFSPEDFVDELLRAT